MNQRPDLDRMLSDWLDSEPNLEPPARTIEAAFAQARQTRRARPRPDWMMRWLSMYGTLQPPARPMARLGLAITVLLLALALGASMVIVGSRIPGLLPNDGLRGAAVIPQGGEAVLAYADFARGDGNGDVYTIRADGTDRHHIGRGFDPTWSPDGSTIAFYSNPGTTGWDLMVADATGVRMLAAQIGCGSSELSPQWSTDSRFVVYPVYQGASADCYANATAMNRTLNVIRADGSGTAHPLLVPGSWTGSSAEWSPSGRSIVLETSSPTDEGFGIADIVDPDAPWGLTLREISKPATDKGWSWPHWSADESLIATSIVGTRLGHLGCHHHRRRRLEPTPAVVRFGGRCSARMGPWRQAPQHPGQAGTGWLQRGRSI